MGVDTGKLEGRTGRIGETMVNQGRGRDCIKNGAVAGRMSRVPQESSGIKAYNRAQRADDAGCLSLLRLYLCLNENNLPMGAGCRTSLVFIRAALRAFAIEANLKNKVHCEFIHAASNLLQHEYARIGLEALRF